jgi:hypothetical protein
MMYHAQEVLNQGDGQEATGDTNSRGDQTLVIDPQLKGEEAGAVYGLVTGASGVVTNFEGEPIGHKDFDPTATYEILAGHPEAVPYAADLLIHEQ